MLKFLKKSAKTQRVISLTKIDCLCIYLMAIIFKDSSSFEVLCNIEAFLCVKKGLLLRNKQSWEFFLYVLQ